ncbi:hypothetical protein PAHAL_2G491600 [Panicum hallii]|uniref:NAC domain-containing protein n=1 Tax=Panicum hallii TaxID=206008 RepID=A0A2S3H4Z9_9POAL|nr:NAC domain-containing protein 87-like [Panicum hallii]PAN15486.1 hypothetical protein PAHAL_2G491600 [Panicum hallii]
MSEVVMNPGEEEPRLVLPPGFRFHPTDAEVVLDYLTPKALDGTFSCVVIADVDLNKTEPWDLPAKAKMGEKEWYFFCHKDRKYPTGMRTNRATASGYWKATGKDKEIYRGRGVLVGMKKTLVFYTGRAPRGEKTPWVMHEYRLEGKLPPNLPRSAKDEWAVCRVFNKDLAAKPGQMAPAAGPEPTIPLDFDDIFGVPPLEDSEYAFEDLLDFKAGAGNSSSSDAAGMGGGGYQVKAEQQNQQALQQGPIYFSLPAASNPGGYPHGAAEQAIRAHCRPEAPALPSPAFAGDLSSRPYPEVDDLLLDDGFIDYSNMLKF